LKNEGGDLKEMNKKVVYSAGKHQGFKASHEVGCRGQKKNPWVCEKLGENRNNSLMSGLEKEKKKKHKKPKSMKWMKPERKTQVGQWAGKGTGEGKLGKRGKKVAN